MTDKKLTAGVWAAIAGAAVPVVIAMISMFSHNVTVLSEHEVRLTNVEDGQRLLVEEILKSSTSRKIISERISHIEGRLQVTPEKSIPVTPAPIGIPQFSTDKRGRR